MDKIFKSKNNKLKKEELSMNKKNLTAVPLPLKIVNDFEKDYPGCYQMCDTLIQKSRKDIAWWDMVYLPIAGTNAIMDNYGYGARCDGSKLHMLYSWCKTKQIFSMDTELVSELIKNTDASSIPVDTLMHVPYNSFYIECSNGNLLNFISYGIKGCFVAFDEDMTEDSPITEKELRIMLVTDNNILIPEYLILKTGISIAEARKQSRSYNFSKSNCQKFTGNVNLFNEYIDAVTNIFASLLNLILYICCENADIEKDSRQRTYTYRKKGFWLIKGCPREIQKWNVGWRIGKTLRNISSAPKPNTPPESPEQHRAICGSPKRPHIRSAHFHHFWTGKKGSAERKLVVHWIPAIAINISTENELAATIHKVY